MKPQQQTSLLEISRLCVSFSTATGVVTPVDGVSLTVARGETVGLVGESGCGKTMTSMAVMGLIPDLGGAITGGSILLEGTELTTLGEKELCAIRGRRISMIFQDPQTSLNPVFTIGDQMVETLKLHLGMNGRDARERAVELLTLTGIPSAGERLTCYPHELSGGMRQRVMIAMSLSANPALIIADEPTTALDVTMQAQILALLKSVQSRLGMSILLITHDLGVVSETADRVVVMYAGRVVEQAPAADFFAKPLHPYSRGLMASLPSLDGPVGRMSPIEGAPPSPSNFPSGCRFHPRCPIAEERCRMETPPLRELGPGRGAACFLTKEAAL